MVKNLYEKDLNNEIINENFENILSTIAESLQSIDESLKIIANDDDGLWELQTDAKGTQTFYNADNNLRIKAEASSQILNEYKVPKLLQSKIRKGAK